MASKSAGAWADRQIDEALLNLSTATGAMYAQRRARAAGRRASVHAPKVLIGAAVLGLMALVAAAIAAIIAVVGAGGAAAWYREHRKRAAAEATAAAPPYAAGTTGSPTGS